MREILGDYDPVIVFVDSEIEEAIRAMAGDLSVLSQRYPSQHGIDWITFQYHLSLMQADAPMGWHAPGFRMGGRIPCQLAIFARTTWPMMSLQTVMLLPLGTGNG